MLIEILDAIALLVGWTVMMALAAGGVWVASCLGVAWLVHWVCRIWRGGQS